jgi:hypothetical protein
MVCEKIGLLKTVKLGSDCSCKEIKEGLAEEGFGFIGALN